MFFTLFWYWAHGGEGVSPKGLVHNLLAAFHPGQLKKSKFSKFIFNIL